MKILLIGATGNCGQRLLKAGLERDHEMTAFARNREKLETQIGGSHAARLRIVIGDVMDQTALTSAMTGQDVIINAAGNSKDGQRFIDLVRLVTDQAQLSLGDGGRLWLFGGVAALNVPGTSIMGVDLPKIPPMFRAHKVNYEHVARTGLDWSLMCPGPLVPATDGKARSDLRVSLDEWPVPRPLISDFLPRIALSLALKVHMPEMTVSYEDVADLIMDHLEPDGAFSHRRVGLALPAGERGRKFQPGHQSKSGPG